MQQKNNNLNGPKPSGKQSRNNKKQHHATHEAGGHQHHRNRQFTNQNAPNVSVMCKICNCELQDLEKEFFPCNCKYKICQKCFWHHVDHDNGKCPNCGLLYEVGRVKEFYASKSRASQLVGAAMNRPRCESPQPSMKPSQSMSQSILHHYTSVKTIPSAQTNAPPESSRGKQSGKQKGQGQTQGKNARQQQQNNQQVHHQPGQSNTLKLSQKDKGKGSQVTEQNQQTPTTVGPTPESQPDEESKQVNKPQQSSRQQTSQKTQLVADARPSKKQRNSSEQQRLQQKLSQVRILQRNTLYVIGLSPNVAKEETLRRYEYFSQYGRILTVTINKEKAFQSENQGLCFSAYINYQSEREASLAMLAVDQFVFDGRLLHASYGRTKYCRFFLKGTNCLNHECPYLHKEAHPENILTQEDMNKKILFQQCQQLALKLSKLSVQSEEQFRGTLRAHKETMMRAMKLTHTNRIIMPQLEQVFDKKSYFKHCAALPPTQALVSGIPQQQQSQPQQQQQQFMQLTTTQLQNPNVSGISQPQSHKHQQHQLQPQQIQTSSGSTGQHKADYMFALSGAPPNTTSLHLCPTSQGQATEEQQKQRSAFRQHRGSEGCNSEMHQSNPNVAMMFGGRGRLQSSGTLGELDFQNNRASGVGQSRWQQLIPHGAANQLNRRVAQDDIYIQRVPTAFRLTGGAYPTQESSHQQVQNGINFSNQQNLLPGGPGNRIQPRFGSPHLPQSRLYFNQQFQPVQTYPTHQKPGPNSGTAKTRLRDSDKATQQSSSHMHMSSAYPQQVHVSQVYSQRPLFSQQVYQVANETRARSGSQAAAASGQQFEEAKMPARRRKSSHSKFRIFEEPRKESPSPGNKEEQRHFGDALRNALQAFVKGDTAHEGDSTGQFSSIFAGGERILPINKIILRQPNNCSEGVAGGQACSPIRDSILYSRRNSEDYGTLTRPRSQHSLIVESVARILDDTALEQRGGDREKQRLQTLNEPNFKTGPPSEVHQLMHEDHQMALNSHFYADLESKWNNQFDLTSSNSLGLTNNAGHGLSSLPAKVNSTQPTMQKSQGATEPTYRTHMSATGNQHYQTFTSPAVNTSTNNNVWNKSSSLYNSPFFLIPSQTNNQQHRSAAFHDNSMRHLPSQNNPFSLGGHNTTQGGGRGTDHGMVNDTWRITYDPHPLLPGGFAGTGGAGQSQSGDMSSAGALFSRNHAPETQSDKEQQRAAGGFMAPMLSRTTSQPFIMRSEQKVSRGAPPLQKKRSAMNNSGLEFSSQMKQAQLTQQNLELLNKRYCPSKDMLYAKIFTDFVPSSPSNLKTKNQVSSFGSRPQHPISVQHQIQPQSLFCFALDGEDDDKNDLKQSKQRHLKLQKQASRDDAAGLLSTPTRRKDLSFFFNSSSNMQQHKETSQTPTNKHSRQIPTNWQEIAANDTRSVNNQHYGKKSGGSGLIANERDAAAAITTDEIEMANQLANEASLGFGDLLSMMHSKSKRSQHAGTRMSAVDADCPPLRSRSQSYRDHLPGEAHQQLLDGSERKQRKGIGGSNFSNRRDSIPSSASSHKGVKHNLVLAAKQQAQQQTSQGPAATVNTTTAGNAAKNFYQEFVRVQTQFRKSSGLVSSSGFGATKVEQRRSSYSQGRNSSHKKTAIQLMEVTRRGSYKVGSLRKSQLMRGVSPLGLLKIKNHQIDEVSADGATARDETVENGGPASARMYSADRQSYNLKTLMKSLSRSRKASHSQNGGTNTNCD